MNRENSSPDVNGLPTAEAGEAQTISDYSDVRSKSDIQATLAERKREFEIALYDMESDAVLRNLLTIVRYDHAGGRTAGVLRPIVNELRDSMDQICADHVSYCDGELVKNRLKQAFQKSMGLVVTRWPQAAAEGADWNALCQTLSHHFERIADLWGIRAEMSQNIRGWFDLYSRNQLNAQALRAHQDLAYYTMQGGNDQRVIEGTRGQIRALESQLEKIPVSPEAAPAFSRINPEFARPAKAIQAIPAAQTAPVAVNLGMRAAEAVPAAHSAVQPVAVQQPAEPVSPWAKKAEEKKGWFRSRVDKVKGWFS